MDFLELGPYLKRRHHRPLSNASKNAPFRCRMRKLWPKQWWRVCWICGRCGSWVGDELQLGEDHGVGVSSVAMPSSSSPSRIGAVLGSILAMSSSPAVSPPGTSRRSSSPAPLPSNLPEYPPCTLCTGLGGLVLSENPHKSAKAAGILC
jgi:hypothetical protein